MTERPRVTAKLVPCSRCACYEILVHLDHDEDTERVLCTECLIEEHDDA